MDKREQAILTAFGSRVRELRMARTSDSQEALAARAGLHRTYLSAVERGERNVSLIQHPPPRGGSRRQGFGSVRLTVQVPAPGDGRRVAFMGFFEPPPPPPPEPKPDERDWDIPAWVGPPGNVLGTPVALQVMLHHSEQLAIAVTGIGG